MLKLNKYIYNSWLTKLVINKEKNMEQICPKSEKCPIFQGGVLKRKKSEQTYRNLYCNAGPEKYKSCVRYRVAEKTGKAAPIKVLPNCSREIEEVIQRME